MPTPRLRGVLRWMLCFCAAVVVLVVAALLLLPHAIDLPAVKRELEQRTARAVQGEVSWRELEFRLLPLPHGLLRDARIDVPGTLSARVEQAEIELRLWPLLRGRLEIQSVRVVQPALRLQMPERRHDHTATLHASAVYQAALRPAVDAMRRFMPDASLVIEGARVEVAGSPIGALAMDLRVVTDADAIAASGKFEGDYWERVALDARIESRDLAASATLQATGLKLQKLLHAFAEGALPGLRLADGVAHVEVRTDGRTSLEARFRAAFPSASLHRRDRKLEIADLRANGTARLREQSIDVALDEVRLGGLVPAARATLRLEGARHAPQAAVRIDELDLVRLRDAALALAGDLPMVREYAPRLLGGRLSGLRLSAQSGSLGSLLRPSQLRGSLTLEDGAFRLPVLEQRASGIGARIELVGETLKLSGAGARIGASQLSDGAAVIALKAPMRLEASGARASLAVGELAGWLRDQGRLGAGQDASGSALLSLHGLTVRFDDPAALTFDASVQPKQVRLVLADFPSVTIDGGSMRVTPDALALERVGAAALDATALVSGTVQDYRSAKPRIVGRVAEAVAGSKAIDWTWQKAGLPAKLRPAAPLRASSTRVRWSPEALGLTTQVRFPAGIDLGAQLEVRAEGTGVYKIALKDKESDAMLSFSKRGNTYDAHFAGLLTDRSLVSLLADPPEVRAGRVRGDLQLRFDRDDPQATSAKGNLDAEDIHLGVLLPVPLVVQRADLAVDGQSLQVRELTVALERQQATLRGEIARRPAGLVVRAQIDSPGVDLDALLPALGKPDGAKPRDLWPLPVTGTVSVRSGYVAHRGMRIEPLRATLALEPRRAKVSVTDAALCGIAFPFSADATPERIEARVRLSAKDAELERVAHCLTDKSILITGRFDLSAELTSSGKLGELVRAVEGPVELRARKGEIRKFALIGNILSVTDVKGVLDKEVRLDRDGFGYRSIDVTGRFGGGRFEVSQAFLDSDAVGLAATGHVGLDYESKLSVLVAPFSRVDRAVRGIPIVGYVIGGAFTSVPVGVSGDIRDPLVVPLGPGAVSSELLGIFERTLKLPQKLVAPLEGKPAR